MAWFAAGCCISQYLTRPCRTRPLCRAGCVALRCVVSHVLDSIQWAGWCVLMHYTLAFELDFIEQACIWWRFASHAFELDFIEQACVWWRFASHDVSHFGSLISLHELAVGDSSIHMQWTCKSGSRSCWQTRFHSKWHNSYDHYLCHSARKLRRSEWKWLDRILCNRQLDE